jgi:hypothetical protein
MTKTDVVAFQNAGLPVGNLAQFAQVLAKAQTSIALKGGEDFLKLSKRDGLWYYGADEVEVQEGSQWAINPASLRMGYMAWGKGQVLGKKLLPILSGQVVDQATLPSVGAPWSETVAMQLRCMSGEDEGKQVEYEQNSYGGKKAFAELLQAFQIQIAQDAHNIVPIVVMKSDSYTHKEFGLIYTPIFEIVRWISMGGAPTPAAVDQVEGEVEEVTPQPEPLHAAQTATKPRRSSVGGTAPAAAAVVEPAPAAKPAVVRQRRRSVAS